MTKELKNAVSRLRKLQDAAFAGKISHTSTIVSLQFYCRHFDGKDRADVDISISTFDDDGNHRQMYWEMTDDICTEAGNDKNSCSHEELLQDIAAFVDYPV